MLEPRRAPAGSGQGWKGQRPLRGEIPGVNRGAWSRVSRAGAARAPGAGARGAYPQVDPGALGLASAAVATVPARATVTQALAVARGRSAVAVTTDGQTWTLRDDLARAALLDLGALPAARLARPVPVLEASASEITVRRHLAQGAPLVIVRDGRRGPAGAVVPSARAQTAAMSLGPRFPERLPERARALLAAVRRVAERQGQRVFLVGGVVREAVRSREPLTVGDLDVAVEGDGLVLARALAAEVGARPGRGLVEHDRFLTASVVTETGGRVDIATARAERYERPGALPRVVPSTIRQDLARRDFTANAMAIELASGSFGVLDPFGGRTALRGRRLTVLHPLSFVEDPTRIFRAARYSARLGFALDAWTARARALAVQLRPYPALSGQRLVAELELIVRDARPDLSLSRLGAWGVFRLLDDRYRFRAPVAAAIRRLPAALAWAHGAGLALAPAEVAVVTVLAAQDPAAAGAALDRLAMRGEPRARVERAWAAAAEPLPPAGAPASVRARRWRGRSDLELFGAWLLGGDQERREVEWFVTVARGVRQRLSGDDVVALGVPAGPAVAAVLAGLRDGVLDGTLADRDAEVAFVRDWISGRKEG